MERLTPEDESWITGQYGRFQYCLDHKHWRVAGEVIKDVEAQEFYAQADDMKKLLAEAKLKYE